MLYNCNAWHAAAAISMPPGAIIDGACGSMLTKIRWLQLGNVNHSTVLTILQVSRANNVHPGRSW